jgi:hypothetical protein
VAGRAIGSDAKRIVGMASKINKEKFGGIKERVQDVPSLPGNILLTRLKRIKPQSIAILAGSISVVLNGIAVIRVPLKFAAEMGLG